MIKKEIQDKIEGLILNTLGQVISEVDLTHPVEDRFGDFSTSVSLKASKLLNRSTKETANDLVDIIYKSDFRDWLEKVEVAGPGFINFFLKKEVFVSEVRKIIREDGAYGQNQSRLGQKVMVEFTDPNPFKEFHIGHLYNNIVGESLCRLFEAQRATVWRVNYQGDVGLHVAKSLWGMLKTEKEMPAEVAGAAEKAAFMGRAYVLGAKAYEEDPEAKKSIIEINQKVYQKDETILPLWQKGRAWSLEYFEQIYQRLSTHGGQKPAFERYYPESEAGPVGLKIVAEGLKKSVFEESEGAVIFPGGKYGLHTRVFINSLGLPTYEAKELGLAPTKYQDFAYDLSVIVTANEIDEYFKVLLKALELLRPELATKTKHLSHGLVRLPEGKMASRTGNILSGEWLLDEAKKYARGKIKEVLKGRAEELENTEEIAEKVGIGAVKYALLKSALGQDIEFSFERSISFEGNCGPYLQYTYARARSVLRRSTIDNSQLTIDQETEGQRSKVTGQMLPEELSILRTLYKFPEVVEAAAARYEPHLLCNFLFDLAQKFNLFYNNVTILASGRQQPAASFRLSMTAAVAQVLKNGLYLLGIDAPERM